jgi:uncharacterized protein YtpQ (UPF0354 family)
MRLAALVFLLAACGGETESASAWRTRLADDALTIEKLNPIVIAAILERFPDARCASTDVERIEITFADGTKQWCYVRRLWEEIARETSAPARAAHIDIRLRAMEEARAAPEEPEAGAIVPLVRSTAYLEELRTRLAQAGDGEAANLACRRLVADLWIVYARDLPKAIVPLTESDVADLGLTEEELHRRAMDNLEKRVVRIENRTLPNGFGMLVCGDDYESSLLLQKNLWKTIAADTKGDLVAGVPNRDLMVYADSATPGAVARLRRLVQEMHDEQARPISPTILRWTGDGWETVSGR